MEVGSDRSKTYDLAGVLLGFLRVPCGVGVLTESPFGAVAVLGYPPSIRHPSSRVASMVRPD